MHLDQIKGQNQAVELLTRAIALERVAPAYLFSGPDGVGRRLAAWGFASLLLDDTKLTNHPDLLWVEPTYLHQGQLLSVTEATAISLSRKTPPQIRIEQIRQITEFLGRPPLYAERAVVVIEAVNQMNESAANALLKTLEEPGLATIILLANPNQPLLPTLISRCQRIPFYRLSDTQLEEVLRQQGYPEIAQNQEIITLAQGSPGAAISIANQLQSIPEDLLQALQHPPQSEMAVFQLARQVTETLDTEGQLWLLDYLQLHYWRSYQEKTVLEIWEKTRRFLGQYVNPPLVWECSLLELYRNFTLRKN